MQNILMTILLGIVEGITEWLPISSTGHLLLLNEFISFGVSDEFKEMFTIVIQLGAIMAVVVLFWKKIWPFTKKEKYLIQKDKFIMWVKIAVACVPAVIIEFTFGDKLEEIFYKPWIIAWALIVFGVAFIVVENMNKSRSPRVTTIAQISFQMAFLIGVFQMIAAIFPGTSRSGATIIGAILFGVSRSIAAEFTFFLAIPTMFGASFVKILDFGFDFSMEELSLLIIGMVVAFVVSIAIIRFLLGYIKKHDFKVFGWYRIVLGILVLICIQLGVFP